MEGEVREGMNQIKTKQITASWASLSTQSWMFAQKMASVCMKVFKEKRDFKGQVIGKHLSETSLFKVKVVIHYGLCNQLSKCGRIFKR